MNQQLLSGSAILSLVLLIAVIWIILKLIKLERIRKEFLASGTGKDLEEVLVDQNRRLVGLKTQASELEKNLNQLIKSNQDDIKKIGFIRFNPFEDDGGNMSFSLALLNEHDNGVVISSLHSRTGTRIYAKAVKRGRSESKLTSEEQQAIKESK
ncbi:MAG: DUF4446 family protein [Candidatus Doudnabacteria bacterium]|nr:DUF4446 family protein [Candidatus Doudnabacteria bacterium]